MGLCKCFLRFIIVIAIFVTAILLIPNLPPYAEFSKSVSIPTPKPLVGPLVINEKLKDTEIWHRGKLSGPEAFAEYNGELYTSLNGGIIAKLIDNQIVSVAKTGKPCKFFYEEHICGRPLGFKFDNNGLLYVADAYHGILRFNIKKDQKEIIVSPNIEINGKKPKLFNSLDVASNGDIYWSDSSTQFQLHNLIYDVLADPTGRLIHFDAKTKKNTVLIDNLYFANGVILSKDEDFVLVSETFYNRIHRYYLKGPKKGTHDVFVDNLPGLPDNLQSDGKDGFLAPLIEPIDDEHPSIAQILFEFPMLRKFVARLMGLSELAIETADSYYPSEIAKKAVHFIGHYRSVASFKSGHPHQIILHLSKNGDIIEILSTTDKKLRGISEAFIFKDHLYLGSPLNDYIGRIPLSKLGWESLKVKRSIEEPKVESTQQPKQQTPSPAKQQTPPPPKATTPPPKQQTPPPPKVTTPPPKQQTPPPPPKATTPPPKQQTPPPPKATTPPPNQQTPPPPPKVTTPPPKQQTPPPPKATTPPPAKQQTPPPPKQQAPPPPKQQTPPPPKQQTPPPPKQQTPPAPKVTTPPPQKSPPSKATTPPPQQQTPPPPKATTPQPKQQTPPPKEPVVGSKQKESKVRNEL